MYRMMNYTKATKKGTKQNNSSETFKQPRNYRKLRKYDESRMDYCEPKK